MGEIRIGSTMAAVLFTFGFLLTGRAQAQDSTNTSSVESGTTVKISGSLSGSSITVPFDLDNDSSTGTGNSVESTAAGDQNVGGEFTSQSVTEGDPKPGTGCSMASTKQAGCNIDGVTNGCLYNLVGGVGTLRFNSNGDISSFQVTGGTECIDFNSSKGFAPPFNFTITEDIGYTGGSGEFVGATGSGTFTGSGRILAADEAGHAFSWFQATYTATMIMP
jgi:hypothetical protein